MKKAIAMCCLACIFLTVAHAQQITLKNGGVTIKKDFAPKSKAAAHLYYLNLRKGQYLDVKVDSNSVFLSEENECGPVFEIFDGGGRKLFLGDAPAGINRWEGEIRKTGNHRIKVYMDCLEAFSTATLQQKKPKFRYSLEVRTKS